MALSPRQAITSSPSHGDFAPYSHPQVFRRNDNFGIFPSSFALLTYGQVNVPAQHATLFTTQTNKLSASLGFIRIVVPKETTAHCLMTRRRTTRQHVFISKQADAPRKTAALPTFVSTLRH
jgi:hypothetical protein